MEKSVGNREQIKLLMAPLICHQSLVLGLKSALEDMEQPNPRLDTVLAYTWTTANTPDERQARIWISAHNPAKIWFNGKEVSTINQDGNLCLIINTLSP